MTLVGYLFSLFFVTNKVTELLFHITCRKLNKFKMAIVKDVNPDESYRKLFFLKRKLFIIKKESVLTKNTDNSEKLFVNM